VANRCSRHALGAGPDGLCVICRRELNSSVSPPAEGGTKFLWIPLGLLTVALAAVAVTRQFNVSPVPHARPAVAALAVEPSAEPHNTTSIASDVASSLPYATQPASPLPSSLPPPAAASSARIAPPESTTRVAERPVTSAAPPANAGDVQRVISNVPITLYEADWCPHCRRAKAWFGAQRLNVTDYDVDHSPDAKRALLRYNPAGGLPTIVIGDKVLVGFSEQQVTQTLANIASQRLGALVTVRAQ